MSLFDNLPLEISQIIYKLSLKDHINQIPKNVFEFHIRKGKERNTYRYLTYKKLHRFQKEVKRLIIIMNNIDHNQSIKEMQDKMFWFEVICRIAIKNAKLMQQTGGMMLVKEASEKLKSMSNIFVTMFDS